MKKHIQQFSYSGSTLLYMGITPAIIYMTTLGCLRYSNKVSYCLSDVLCFDEHFTKFYIYPFVLIMIINLLKEEFRAGVVLRYRSSAKFMMKLSRRLIIIAALVGAYQTILTTAMGLVYTPYQCNWDSLTGYPFFLVKNVVTKVPPTAVIILAYFLSVFLTTLVISMFVMVLWWLTETPVTGFIIIVGLLSIETNISIYVNVLFSIVSLRPDKIFLSGIDPWSFLGYPILIILLLFISGTVIIRKIDFQRLK